MEKSAAAEGMDAPTNGLSDLIARMVQRQAAELQAMDLAALTASPGGDVDGLEAAVDRMGGDFEAMRAWLEGLEARQAQLTVLLRLRVEMRAAEG